MGFLKIPPHQDTAGHQTAAADAEAGSATVVAVRPAPPHTQKQ
jgi:hypothetical protein